MRRVSGTILVSALLAAFAAGCGSSDESGAAGTGGSGGSSGAGGAGGAGGTRSDAATDAILDASGTADRRSDREGSAEVGDAGAESLDATVDVSSDAAIDAAIDATIDATIDETTTDTPDTTDAALDQALDAPSEPSSDGNADTGTPDAGGCSAASECPSGVCDVGVGATRGQCIAASDIIYVDNANGTCTNVGADGSASHPYCQIAPAANLVTVSSRHYVKVAGSTSPYDALDFDTTLTAAFTGPGRDATPPATILGSSGNSALLLDPLTGSLNLTFDGFVFSQSGNNASTILCSGGNTAPFLVIRNSAIMYGRNGFHAQMCTAVITETIIASASKDGALFESGSTWMLENDIIHHCGTVGLSVDTQGVARFNTLAANGTGNAAGGVICTVAQTLQDSIVATNAQTAGGSQFSGPCTLDHVVTGNDSIVSTGKVAGQPVFVGTSDFHLSVGTPTDLTANRACCIDQVPDVPQNPVIDFERDPRPRGAASDLGADEAN